MGWGYLIFTLLNYLGFLKIRYMSAFLDFA